MKFHLCNKAQEDHLLLLKSLDFFMVSWAIRTHTMRLEKGFSFAPSAAFNSFHGVSMALVNNYKNELIKWLQGQTFKEQYQNV